MSYNDEFDGFIIGDFAGPEDPAVEYDRKKKEAIQLLPTLDEGDDHLDFAHELGRPSRSLGGTALLRFGR